MNRILKKLVVCLICFFAVLSLADEIANPVIETSSQDLLIQKLTQIQLNLAGSDPARSGILLRLADLHSERARLLSMKEINEGCTVCKAADPDRTKAIQFYTEALEKTLPENSTKILLQLGHLFELQGSVEKAESKYSEILKLSKAPLEIAEANLSLAEATFKKSNYALAKNYYQAVLAIEGASSQGLAAYRQAWCLYKLGQVEDAIAKLKIILTDIKLQSRLSVSRGVADMQFLEEVSRDMVTFMAARGIQDKDAQVVFDLTPENFKLTQIVLLAREGLRLGQKQVSLQVWDFVYQKHTDPKIRLEAKTRQAQLLFDLKNIQQAQIVYVNALSFWSSSGCTIESCEEIYKGLRAFVISWNRLEIKKASPELLSAYQDYLKTFGRDLDMIIWATQAAVSGEQFKLAVELSLSANQILSAANDKEQDKEKLEKNLLITIEIAEKSKDEMLLDLAQNDYIQKSLSRSKILSVQYQKAYSLYQKENYKASADQLHALALSGTDEVMIRTQAADLALDSLVILKDDDRLKIWSKEFAEKFPQKKMEYGSILQKSILTQVAKLATTDSAQALTALNQFDLKLANAEDKKLYFKNKILLLEKLSKISDARLAVEDFLRLENLNQSEIEFALERKAWFAELELDFVTALKATEAIKKPGLIDDGRILKMALFADLAEMNSVEFYSAFLKQSKDREKKALIALALINKSKNPEIELNRLKIHFADQPELLAQAVLDVYDKTKNQKILESLLKIKFEKPTQVTALVERIIFVGEAKASAETIEKHQIVTTNSKKLSASLKQRTKLLEQLDVLANRAIATADWTSQVLSLNLVAEQNKRFYSEVLSLPVPDGLVGEQEQEYLTLLSQQVAPNQSKAQLAEKKLSEFWGDLSISQKFTEAYENSMTNYPALQEFVNAEIAAVAAIAPAEVKSKLTEVLAKIESDKTKTLAASKPTLIELEKARMIVKENPFEASALQNFLNLERSNQRPSMVKYLETRLSGLQKDKDLETK